jgi:hypothetical protein
MCLDSGASMTIVPAYMITKNWRYATGADACTVTWGDKSTSVVLIIGTMVFDFGGEHFEIEAWGVSDIVMPLLSVVQLSAAGVETHYTKDGNYIDLASMDGDTVAFGEDSMLSAEVIVGWEPCATAAASANEVAIAAAVSTDAATAAAAACRAASDAVATAASIDAATAAAAASRADTDAVATAFAAVLAADSAAIEAASAAAPYIAAAEAAASAASAAAQAAGAYSPCQGE